MMSGDDPARSFGLPGPAALPADTLGVAALARGIRDALRQAFPSRVWVVGEASELERNAHRRHWFFKLSETCADDGKQYSLSAVLWGGDVKRLFGRGGELDGVIEPRDGIEIRALCDIDFYPPHGALRLVVRAIDPAYTLGRMALEKKELIERLQREGLLERQKQLVAPAVPLTIGLLTSENSAAYNDFVREIEASGLAFRILFFDARMQGEDTVRTVLRGLDSLSGRGVELIALVRGGGSMVDLAWFDREEIARAIAACEVPVFTGIGHEIDSTIADLTAHSLFKTPTAVAAALVEKGQAALRDLGAAYRDLATLAEQAAREREALQVAVAALGQVTGRLGREGRVVLLELLNGVQQGCGRVVRRVEQMVGDLRLGLTAASIRALNGSASELSVLVSRLRGAPTRLALSRASDRLLERSAALLRCGGRRLSLEGERHEALRDRARLLDPERIVQRGFAILRDPRGKVVSTTTSVGPGDHLSAALRDGRLELSVERVETESEKSQPEERQTTEEAVDGGSQEGSDREPGGTGQLEIW